MKQKELKSDKKQLTVESRSRNDMPKTEPTADRALTLSVIPDMKSEEDDYQSQLSYNAANIIKKRFEN
jgi:hypothetical protein